MRRRAFITLLAGVAAWPLIGRAQQPAMPAIGFLNSTSPDPFLRRVAAFREGLAHSGYIERQNVAIQYRWANNQYDRLPALAADLVLRQAAVIAATGGTDSGLAAKRATAKIPIVFGIGGDPIAAGLVESLSRPAGNLTGMSLNAFGLAPQQLALLRELKPTSSTIAVLINPDNPNSQIQTIVETAARATGIQILILKVNNELGFGLAFKTMIQQRADALLIGPDAYLASRRDEIVALAARYGVPTIYQFREFVDAGGLISFGSSLTDGYRQVGAYAGRILRGAKPADLPVIVSTKFELVINLGTARALHLDVPPTLLARADKVIE